MAESGGSEEDEESEEAYPSGHPPVPVTPKMLVKALRKLKKASFKNLFFGPKEVSLEIAKTHPAVEQDFRTLLLEVSDKLACAAAAGLLGVVQKSGYFAYEPLRSEARADLSSELMFWIFYKRLLKKRAQEKRLGKETEVDVRTPAK